MTRFTLKILTFAVFTLALTSLAQAQATRTWVSGVGDDVNPCSRTAPCKTFAGAISKTAAGGEINAIDPGGYGTITITKSIVIDGGGTFSSILACGTNGVVVNDSATAAPGTIKVALRNLSINGCRDTTSPGVNGIRYISGNSLTVENVVIQNFGTHGIDVSLTGAGELNVKDTVITNCGSNGINTVTTAAQISIAISGVRVSKCATGIRLSTGSRAIVNNSESTQNSGAGLTADEGALNTEVNIERSVFALNGVAGIQAGGGASEVRLSNSFLTQNGANISLTGGTVRSGGNNRSVGNGTETAPNGVAFSAY